MNGDTPLLPPSPPDGRDGVTLAAVGDVCLGENLLNLGFGPRTVIDREGPAHVFARIRDLLQGHDIVFGNLESVLSDDGLDPADPTTRYLRGSPEAVDTLRDGGFHVMSIANNHTRQYGSTAFHETVARLEEAGIRPVGLARNGQGSCEPVVMERRGTTFGFLAYSHVPDQHCPGAPPYAFGGPEVMRADIARLRPEVDRLVVSVHWGLEYLSFPSRSMRALGRALVSWGADLVLGHHPHVVQGHERHGGGHVYYSLGNTVFDQVWWGPSRRSCLASVTFPPAGDAPDATMIPLAINDAFQPEPVPGAGGGPRLIPRWWRGKADGVPDGLYTLCQKPVLACLAVRKSWYLVRHLAGYEPGVRRYLLLRKLLRLPYGRPRSVTLP